MNDLRHIIAEYISNPQFKYDNYGELYYAVMKSAKCSKKDVEREISNMFMENLLTIDSHANYVLVGSLDRLEKQENAQNHGKYSTKKSSFLEGTLTGNVKGFAFVSVDGYPDFFIPPKSVNGALHGDRVLIRPIVVKQQSNKRSSGNQQGHKENEAEVVSIQERGIQKVVGVYYEGNGYSVVQPLNDKFNTKILVDKSGSLKALPGELVEIQITGYPTYQQTRTAKTKPYPKGVIIENLGEPSLKSYIECIKKDHNIATEFPPEVLEEARNVKEPTIDDCKKRKNFIELETYTIDGDDARDFDDAISIDKTETGYKLYIHIADVGNYVKRGSAIEREAYNRGTSTYFPNSVEPMLPVELSNGVCSLNPEVIRLTLSCVIDYDKEGNVIKSELFESAIKSNGRLTYDKVNQVLDNKTPNEELYQRAENKLKEFQELALLLQAKAKERGCLDILTTEKKFKMIDYDTVETMTRKEQGKGEHLIESFMIAANEQTAKTYKEKELPFVYRVHDKPQKEKFKMIEASLQKLGINTSEIPNEISKEVFEAVQKKLEDKIGVEAVNTMLLRAMPKALYLEEPRGHFGLALDDYTHFTSPIRRLCDLTIHWIIKDGCNNRLSRERVNEYAEMVVDYALRASKTELEADKAEREVDDLLAAKYMERFVGEEFVGTVAGFSKLGIYVGLECGAQGLIPFDVMPGRYYFDEKTNTVIGEKQQIVLADKMAVKVVSTSLSNRTTYFDMQKLFTNEEDANKYVENLEKLKKNASSEQFVTKSSQTSLNYSSNSDNMVSR